MCPPAQRPELRHAVPTALRSGAGATAAVADGVTAQRGTAALVGVACSDLLGDMVISISASFKKSDKIGDGNKPTNRDDKKYDTVPPVSLNNIFRR